MSPPRFGREKAPQLIWVGEGTLSTEGLQRKSLGRKGSMRGAGEEWEWEGAEAALVRG